jgi:hypothetical protein
LLLILTLQVAPLILLILVFSAEHAIIAATVGII